VIRGCYQPSFSGTFNPSPQMKMAPVRGAIFLSPIERDLY
jgi:hypothetical protein